MAKNLPIGFINENSVAARESEQTIGNAFLGGGNKTGSNACGIGINTGDFDPKISDWRHIPKIPFVVSQHLGGSGLGDGDRLTWPLEGQLPDGSVVGVAFVQAEQDTQPLGVLDTNTGAINRSGKIVPAGAWVFGSVKITDLPAGVRVTGDHRVRVTGSGDYRVVE